MRVGVLNELQRDQMSSMRFKFVKATGNESEVWAHKDESNVMISADLSIRFSVSNSMMNNPFHLYSHNISPDILFNIGKILRPDLIK